MTISLLKDGRHKRPEVAVVGPADSTIPGVAEYSRRTVKYMSRICRVHYVSAHRPSSDIGAHVERWHRGVQVCSDLPTLTILGNHPQNLLALEVTQSGDADVAVVHDASLLSLVARHAALSGTSPAIALPADWGRELNSWAEWLDSPFMVPFPIMPAGLKTTRRVVVHSALQATFLAPLGIRAEYVPVAAEDRFNAAESHLISRPLLRESLALPQMDHLVVSFGYVQPAKRVEILLNAIKMLSDSGHSIALILVGIVPDSGYEADLLRHAEVLEIGDRLHFEKAVSDRRMGLLAAAADLAVQLRDPFFGQLSGAVADAIEARVQVLASEHLIDAIPDSGGLCTKLPAVTSSVILAEAISRCLVSPTQSGKEWREWEKYMHRHHFAGYADALLRLVLDR